MIVMYVARILRDIHDCFTHFISALIVISSVLFIVLMDCLFYEGEDEDEDDTH